jgi:hypothetical protein
MSSLNISLSGSSQGVHRGPSQLRRLEHTQRIHPGTHPSGQRAPVAGPRAGSSRRPERREDRNSGGRASQEGIGRCPARKSTAQVSLAQARVSEAASGDIVESPFHHDLPVTRPAYESPFPNWEVRQPSQAILPQYSLTSSAQRCDSRS